MPTKRRNLTKLGWQRAFEPEAWEAAVRAALAKHRTIGEAAEELGCSRPQLHRWLKDECFADLPERKRGPQPEK